MPLALLQTGLAEIAGGAGGLAAGAVQHLAWDYRVLGIAVILIVATVLIFFFIKKIIINSILGLVAWAVAYFLLGIKMPFIMSLVVSVVFGLAGFGALLLLAFFGVL